MNQWTRTGIFAGIAVACVLFAVLSRPRPIGPRDGESAVGQVLFEKLTNPKAINSMEILHVDSGVTAGGGISDFKVARIDGRWVIPSHQKYPADAEDQMATAANALIGVKTISVASDVASDHETFGVLEPDPKKTSSADEGVGTLVVMKDDKGKDLAKLIIGKKVADTENQRFVRRPGQDRVYTASIDEDAFSTKFEDWIEEDLLELSPSDIRKLVIRDYSVQAGINMAGQLQPAKFTQRLDMTLDWNQDDYKWEVNRIQENRNNRMVDTELLDDEELNKSKLDDMKNALDDLKIVDVERKPKGVGADLQANDELLKSPADCQNLARRGFFPAMMNGQLDLISSDGEIVIGTEDAVEYVLRFGDVAGVSGEGDESKLNRFLFVTARLDEAALQPPELEQLPELPEGEPAGDADAGAADDAKATAEDDSATPPESTEPVEDASKATDAEATDASKAEDTAEPGPSAPQGAEGTEGVAGTVSDDAAADTPSDTPADAEAGTAESGESPAPADDAPAETGESTDDPAGEPAKAESGEAAEDAATESKTDDGDTEAAAPADDSDAAEADADTPADGADGEAKPPAEEESPAPEPIDIEAEQERIVRDNKRKMDEYEEKKKKAEKKVRELNARFADWYFVISDDVYKKIHLSRSDVIKEKEGASKEGSGVDALRDLEGGIDTKKDEDK
jgi:hypothetical protein